MTENEEAKTDKPESDDLILDLNFAPSWARTEPDVHVQRFKNQSDHFDDEGGRVGKREYGRDNQGERRKSREQRERSMRRTERRAPRREAEFDGSAGGKRFDAPRPEHREVGRTEPPRGGEYAERRRGGAPYRERPTLPIEVRILPEQKALGAIIRHIQLANRAYPLRDIAALFIDKPGSCLLRVEVDRNSEKPINLFQCKICGVPAMSEEEVEAHLINQHLDDYFDVEEVDCEPPSGAFVCVARCGLSGTLLGPPNHHSYNSKVQEMLRTRYAGMGEEAYRARIEVVREEEVIEQWRQECTRKKVYRRKGVVTEPLEPVAVAEGEEDHSEEQEPAPKSPAMERETAELVFRREILPGQTATLRSLNCTAAVAMQTPSRELFYTMRDAFNREKCFPASLFFALRGAFRHRKLHLFRVNDPRGSDFVMARQPVALDVAHAVQELRDIITFIEANPDCTKAEMLKRVVPDSDEAKLREALKHLAWLVERGHVIHYYNDVLSAPAAYPMFRFLPGEKHYRAEVPPQEPPEEPPLEPPEEPPLEPPQEN